MKKTLLLILLFTISCSKKKNISNSESDKNHWVEYNTKDSIPKQLREVLITESGDSKIANKNEKFESTDYIEDSSLPRKQLRLLCRKENKWRLTYLQGGIGEYYVYIQCEIKNNKIINLKIAETLLNVEINDSVTELLKKGKIEFEE